jgi:hypothetical protein
MPFAKFKLQDVYDSNSLDGERSWRCFWLQGEERQKINETSAIGTYNKPLTNLQYHLVLV